MLFKAAACSCVSSCSNLGRLCAILSCASSCLLKARNALSVSLGGSRSCSWRINFFNSAQTWSLRCWRDWSAAKTARSRSGSSAVSMDAGASLRSELRSSFKRRSSSGSMPSAAILTRTSPRLSISSCSLGSLDCSELEEYGWVADMQAPDVSRDYR